VNLSSGNLIFAHLTDVKLMGANLSGADFSKADMTEVDLSNANLTETDFSDANLSLAILDNAIVTKTKFRNANMKGSSRKENNIISIKPVQPQRHYSIMRPLGAKYIGMNLIG